MNTRKLYQGKYQDFSFRDLEYGIKLLNEDIRNIDMAITTLNHAVNTAKGTKQSKHYQRKTYADVIVSLENRKTHIREAISLTENEMTDRLLTGNDDGIVERELLGANYV